MPINIFVDSQKNLMIAKCTGELNETDFQIIFSQISQSPGYKSSYNEVWDLRDVIDISLSFDGWDGLNNSESTFETREAIVVSTTIQHELAKQYTSLAKDTSIDVRIFYDYDEAIEWAASE